MTGQQASTWYAAEVRAEGPVYGTREVVTYVLATFQTISPELALGWVRGQALWLASRLDPDPARSAWARPVTRQSSVPLPDAPAELRAWAGRPDPAGERAACAYLTAGYALALVVPDADCTYTLSLRPVSLPAPAPRLTPSA
ncbi:hypothetical protein JJV70_15005 [Streptomyces sp. JJ66]|uniref:hypothetical protein n=1 Tax=Streptomyces sp. JJ66 TaxID=2803843 RepID=UPI001C58F9AD|nr:hypothetical protein [Streptomyces sp. JJ66]MBW1603387.1 hypothetical protein [Streptomyces sp. JJ66]